MARLQRIGDFGSLPRDPDRDAPLLDARHPERTRDEIVLSNQLERKLERIESEFRQREALARLGLAPKSRLLFIGPPGCGKTLCAEILASDLGLTLLHARFDGIVSSYLGETANNLRRVFTYARQQLSVLFFDEFDALGKRRDDPQDVGELKRVVSSFLQLLDAYPKNNLLIAATNHEGLLDDALWRRFDEVLYFSKPSLEQLIKLMHLRLRSVRKRELDFDSLAKDMEGFTFADAERVCFEAAKAMVLEGKKEVTQELFSVELIEQKERIALAAGRPPAKT
jgi:SpoVK/Ycf46/Vps4 family AAA+-type ATPase